MFAIGPSQVLFCGLAYLSCVELNPDHEHIISLLFWWVAVQGTSSLERESIENLD